MFISRNVIYEKEDDFSTNDYDDISTDLIKFCNSKVSNYDVKEINQSNFFSELHNFETKPWMIKFVYYESYTNFSNFRKAYVIGIYLMEKEKNDSVIQEYKLKNYIKQHGKNGFVLRFGKDLEIIDQENTTINLELNMKCQDLIDKLNNSLNI